MTELCDTTTIRLLLVDDHAVMRSGLANLLNAHIDFQVVGEAGDAVEARRLYRKFAPDVTLLDVMMPGIGGIECLRSIKQDDPAAVVLMLSSSEFQQDIMNAIKIGAAGYIPKTARPSELMEAIRTASQGTRYVNGLTTQIERATEHTTALTSREMEVLHLLREGMSNPQIGRMLGITSRTAKAHVAAIMLKLDANDRAQAVARGFELGWLRP